jgi:hypothetical protein
MWRHKGEGAEAPQGGSRFVSGRSRQVGPATENRLNRRGAGLRPAMPPFVAASLRRAEYPHECGQIRDPRLLAEGLLEAHTPNGGRTRSGGSQ